MNFRPIKKTLVIVFIIIFFILNNSILIFSFDRSISIVSTSELNHNSVKTGKYTGIIIGINKYKDKNIQDLDTAVNDAKAISSLLTNKYGFYDINLLTDDDATRIGIDMVFRNKISSIGINDSLLIYFAGHGDIDRELGGGWWLPSDAKGGYPGTYIDNTIIQKYIKAMKAKHVLLISDSCYSGTLFGIARKAPPIISDNYFINLFNEKSRWGFTSGNITTVSDSGTNNHSIFAYQLLKMLNKNKLKYLTPRMIYENIAPVICNNAAQKPMCLPIRNTGDQGGEFIFILASNTETYNTKIFLPRKDSGAIHIKKSSKNFGRIFIHTFPQNAKIQILNIKPRFRQGITLPAGNYKIEISASGYQTLKKWVELEQGEDLNIRIHLEQEKSYKILSGRALLRSTPSELNYNHVASLIKKYNFYDSNVAPRGNFNNDFVDNTDGTITDRATNLMWQKSGSNPLEYKEINGYIAHLNRQRFAGYNDWRLPTIEELLSIKEKKKRNGLYINPIFDSRQDTCWTSDKHKVRKGLWVVSFGTTYVDWLSYANKYDNGMDEYIRAVRLQSEN